MRIEEGVEARNRKTADLRCRLKSAGQCAQVPGRCAQKIASVIVDQPRSAALEIRPWRAGLPIGFAFQHHAAQPRCPVEKRDGWRQPFVATLLNPVQRTAYVEIGTEIGWRDIVDHPALVFVAQRQRPARPACRGDIKDQLQRLRIIADRDADSFEIGSPYLTLLGQPGAQPFDELRCDARLQQRQQAFCREACLPARLER